MNADAFFHVHQGRGEDLESALEMFKGGPMRHQDIGSLGQ